MNSATVKLTPALARSVEEVHRALSSALVEREKIIETHDKVTDKATKVGEEIAKLEQNLDPMVDEAVAILAARQKQFELLTKRLNVGEDEMDAADEKVFAALNHVPDVLGNALQGSFRALLDEVSESILPFCGSQSEAQSLARNTTAVRSFQNFLACFWRTYPIIEQAERATRWLEMILKGQNPWVWKK